jgi:hypothetical protein
MVVKDYFHGVNLSQMGGRVAPEGGTG